MERQEEAWQHDKQRQQRFDTANYVDVKTNNGAVGGGMVAGEGAVHEQ
jgi:hypothetical protein